MERSVPAGRVRDETAPDALAAGRPRLPMLVVTRRRIQVILGLLWILDGVLQLQSSMFSAYFYGMMLTMGRWAPPGWLWPADTHLEPLLTAHAALFNAAFGLLQLALGAGLLWRPTVRAALAASVPWALAVWLFGEAAGGIFVPGGNALTGSPGPALLYALVAVLVWPRRSGPLGVSAVVVGSGYAVWAALWLGTAGLEAEPLNRMALYASGEIYGAGDGGPGWLASLDHAIGNLAGPHGTASAIVMGLAQAGVGLSIIWPPAAPGITGSRQCPRVGLRPGRPGDGWGFCRRRHRPRRRSGDRPAGTGDSGKQLRPTAAAVTTPRLPTSTGCY